MDGGNPERPQSYSKNYRQVRKVSVEEVLSVFIYIHISLCVCEHEFSAYRGQKRVMDTLELEFQAVVSLSTWVLRIKLGFSA